MSHDTNHENSKENKTIISFKNSFWLVIIIVGLFIAALNFIKAESGPDEEKGKEATENAVPVREEKALETPQQATTQDTAVKAQYGKH